MCVDLNIKEVAHDYATSVSDYITNDLQLLNSYDTWHGMHYLEVYSSVQHLSYLSIFVEGTKNVAKAIKKVAQGSAKWEGNKWFRELSDKCML